MVFPLPVAVLDAELSLSTVILSAVVIAAFVWITRSALHLHHMMERELADIESKMKRIEKTEHELRARVENLYDEVNERVDYAYLNERLDELQTFFTQRRKTLTDKVTTTTPNPATPYRDATQPLQARALEDYVARRRR